MDGGSAHRRPLPNSTQHTFPLEGIRPNFTLEPTATALRCQSTSLYLRVGSRSKSGSNAFRQRPVTSKNDYTTVYSQVLVLRPSCLLYKARVNKKL